MSSQNSTHAKKVAVILCGSGFRDGSEIRESVAVLHGLSKRSLAFQCFAPDLAQHDVVNCLTGQEVKTETRHMRVEAARIARGDVLPLDDLREQDFAALIIPGGFGVAKNLCTFALQGSQGTVLMGLEEKLHQFMAARKPIGAVCIAPAVLALAFKKQKKLKLTLGAPGETSQEIEKLGHQHIACAATEIAVDEIHRVVSSPAYMYGDASLADVFVGIDGLVDQIDQWL